MLESLCSLASTWSCQGALLLFVNVFLFHPLHFIAKGFVAMLLSDLQSPSNDGWSRTPFHVLVVFQVSALGKCSEGVSIF